MIKPQDMTIIVDTREQTPLKFIFGDIEIPTKRGTMKTGDYTVEGYEQEISVERKSLQDLVGCIGHGRDRFKRELDRLVSFPTRALVIESTWEAIESQKYRGKVSPNAVIGSLMSWQERYNLPIMMTVDHQRAGLLTARFLFSAVRRRYREKSA